MSTFPNSIPDQVLANITADGFPRASWYTVDHLTRAGLLVPTGDLDHPYRLVEHGEQFGLPL